ncbi:phytoene/squalene synthase family protein [Treponema sp. OMZ 838]|uniref:phytoene/squalene synthase family protein n=1 Tax=Treponema sp. OMZ 838 TaxID=1539298 RepID=UPI000B31DC21|nr:phytoene/squalene synthase family protein [Treponema sp. OMZ 838]
MIAAQNEDKTITVLEQSYRAARILIKNRAKSFYRAFSRLSEERFNAVAAVYAFCRYADDLVDDVFASRTAAQTEALLENLEKTVLSLYGGRVQDASRTADEALKTSMEEWLPALTDTVQRFSIPKDGFLAQIRGQYLDLHFQDIKTSDELIEYCRLVAGSVGLMLAPILADEKINPCDEDFLSACENLGIGMQITNILRDIGEDILTRNRIYLPQDMMITHNLTKDDILHMSKAAVQGNIAIPAQFTALWEELSRLGTGFYNDYVRYLMYFQSSCRLSVAAAALIYQAIEDEVRKNGYNCFSRRCSTSKLTKFKLILKATQLITELQSRKATAVSKER